MKNGLIDRDKGDLEAVRHVEHQSIFINECYFGLQIVSDIPVNYNNDFG